MVKITAAILILLALGMIVYLVVGNPKMETGAPNTKSLSPISTDCLDKIEITKNTGALRKSESIILKKQGSKWKMTSPIESLVNLKMVESMIDTLSGLKTIAVVSDNKDQLNKFELQEGRGIDVAAYCGEKPLTRLTIGTANIDITYLKEQGDDTVYQATGALRSTFNKTVRMLRDRNIFDFERSEILRVKYSNLGGELTLVKKDSPGNLVYEPVGTTIENFNNHLALASIGVLAKLNARDFVDEPLDASVTGLDENAPKVEFETLDSNTQATRVIWIGKENHRMRQTYLKTSLSDQVFLISSHFVKSLKLTAKDLARTDEQVAQEEEMRKKAALHAHKHHHH